MRAKNSRSLMFVVCLTICALGVSLTGCGGDKNSGGARPGEQLLPLQGITRIVINSTDSPAFEGHVFGPAGTYDRIKGTAYGALDPNDPRNQIITDIALAPTNEDGLVEYEAQFYILTPTDPAKGNKKVFYEPPNRGGKRFGNFNQSGGVNNVGDLASHASFETSTVPIVATPTYPAFLMNKGYTMVWSAWDMEPMEEDDSLLKAKLPVARNPDNSSITGPVYEYLVSDSNNTECQTVYYNPVDNNTAATGTTLTRRQFLTDDPEVVPASQWKWNGPGLCAPGGANANSISLIGAPFQRSWIYELEYIAKDPYVAAVGLAAMRDFVSFIRYSNDSSNPLAGNVQQVISWTQSQPARLMNDYLWLGFNEDTAGRRVLDGALNWVAGGNGIGINVRFAQVGRTERNRQNHIAQAEGIFPFSYTKTFDELTQKEDGRNVRCTASNTCPKIMNIYSSNEIWVKSASLLTRHPNTGADLQEPENVRNYLISSAKHGSGVKPATPSTYRYFDTTVDIWPVIRALWVALDEWVSGGIEPPASKVPRTDNWVLIPANNNAINALGISMAPLAELGFPALPDNIMTGSSMVVTVRNHWYFGPRYDQGILDFIPAVPTGRHYKSFVPKVDANGNELGGLILPELVAPLGSNAGWNLRSAAYGGKADGTDGGEGTGAFIPFALYDNMVLPGDSRPSLQTRYGTGNPAETMADWHANWLAQRETAANALLLERFLLPNDAANYTASGNLPFVVMSHDYNPYSYTWEP